MRQGSVVTSKRKQIRIIVIGDSYVGKTALALKFTTTEEVEQQLDVRKEGERKTEMTIFDMRAKDVVMDNGDNLRMLLIDTAGAEQYKSLSRQYYMAADGVILVYDVTKRKTFENVERWREEALTHSKENVPIFVVGNKCDIEHGRQVKSQEGSDLAKEMGRIKFFETSAITGFNVGKVFMHMANTILEG